MSGLLAFFASLRTNLRLHASPPPSPISTPNSMRGSAASLPPPSPLSAPVMSDNENNDVPPTSSDPLAGVPELQTYLATDDHDRFEALKLVADSVAQQRNAANRALIFHPLNLAIMVPILAVVWRLTSTYGFDALSAGMTCMGVVMIAFIGCRASTGGYLYAAEKINWEWAGDVDVLLTKFGDEVIGTALIEWQSGDSKRKGKKAWQGVVKAWTVKLRYRGKGVGTALLEEAVKEAKKKGAESLEFADEHASEYIHNHPRTWSVQDWNVRMLTFDDRFHPRPPQHLQRQLRQSRSKSAGEIAGSVADEPCEGEEEMMLMLMLTSKMCDEVNGLATTNRLYDTENRL